MDIIRDVLDNQLVDRNQRNMGKVDGIIMELRDPEPPRLAYIEVGVTTLARRINPRLAGWVAAIARTWGAKQSEPFRIPWSKVRDVGIDVEVDVEAQETPALAYEKWLSDRIITRIPGANHGE
jgi:sporulation protein YlmC with PRC-barrel domain